MRCSEPSGCVAGAFVDSEAYGRCAWI